MGITTGVLACSANPSWFSWTMYMVICLGGVAGPTGGYPLSSSASPVFRVWAITWTHSFLSLSYRLMLSASILANASTLILKILTCATANLTLTALVRFSPIRFFINLSIELSTCFLRMHAWEYFIFLGCTGQIWFSLGVCLQSVDGSALVLKIFQTLQLHITQGCLS